MADNHETYVLSALDDEDRIEWIAAIDGDSSRLSLSMSGAPCVCVCVCVCVCGVCDFLRLLFWRFGCALDGVLWL